MKKNWWKEIVIYQIYLRSFYDSDNDGIGDIPGITEKLPYIKNLGVDAIWITPFFPTPGKDMGYDVKDYKNVDPVFGTLEDFDNLLKQAHEIGIKIIIDMVLNHTSEEHPWFIESKSGKDNPYRDYYIWRDGKNDGPPNNWGCGFSDSAWKYDENTDQYYLHTFGEFQPDLNWDNEKVRQEICDILDFWCKKGVDGFRFDAISQISKTKEMPDGIVREGTLFGNFAPYVISGPNVHKYLQELNEKVLRKYDIMTVGECGGLTVEEAIKYANSDDTELNMVFQFEHTDDLDWGNGNKWTTRKISIPELKKTLSKWQTTLHNKAWNSLYYSNHDHPRIVSRLGDDREEFREKSAKAIALFLHMMQGTPYVYQGEEIAMTNFPFKDISDFKDVEAHNAYKELTESNIKTKEEMLSCLRYKSRDNGRTPMQWDDCLHGGFTKGTPWLCENPNYRVINASEQINRDDSVLNFYKKLISLRHEKEVMVYGDYTLLLPEDENIFAFVRSLGEKSILSVSNLSGKTVPFETDDRFINGTVIISNSDVNITKHMELGPWEAFAVEI